MPAPRPAGIAAPVPPTAAGSAAGFTAHSERHAHRALAQEPAAHATSGDRDDLAALVDGRGYTDSEAAEILASQAHVDVLRDSDPPFWPFTGVVSSTESRPGARRASRHSAA